MVLSKGEYNQANTVLASIPSSFSLSPSQIQTHQSYVELCNLLEIINTDTNLVFNIDSTTESSLQSIVANGNGLTGTYARNILIAAEKIKYQEPIILSDSGLKSSKKKKFKGVKEESDDHILSVYPNPASNYFIVKFTLSDFAENPMLTLRDETGKTVWSKQLTRKTNQEVVPVSELNSGIYLMTIEIENRHVESFKITIVN